MIPATTIAANSTLRTFKYLRLRRLNENKTGIGQYGIFECGEDDFVVDCLRIDGKKESIGSCQSRSPQTSVEAVVKNFVIITAIQTVERLEPDEELGGLYFSGKQGLTGLSRLHQSFF